MSPIVRLDNFAPFTAINLLKDPGYDASDRHIPSCVQVVLNFGLEDGKPAHIVTHASYLGGFTPTSTIAQNLTNALSSGGAWTALALLLAPTTQFVGVTLRDLNTPNQPLIPNTVAGPSGTAAGEALPNEVAAVITLRTAKAGRSARGRMYFPGWAAIALAPGNVMSAAAVTALGSWANTIIGVYQAQGLTMALGLYSRKQYTKANGDIVPARSPTTLQVTSLTVRDNHWDSQRRRGLK